MTDYEQLVKALRHLSTGRCDVLHGCEACAIYETCLTRCVLDAAAAIEDLQAEVEKYKTAWAVERENRLGIEEPKRGEWIYEDVDNFRKYKVTCPHCGAWFVGNYDAYDEPSEFLYCPHCGNICNPTDLDWENELKEREKESRAKMEVQE